ncbi:MAG: 4Fe-4S dicluster domain-containing protein [Deltaproteobacteria bacterium]|nr:4Fe-4S dicluster domain-containing protein [Deltaproteobacteria bacterium]
MTKLLVKSSRCVRCRACELACSLRQCGEFNLKRSAIKAPLEPLSREKVAVCRQCARPACVQACPEGALSQGTLVVLLDRDLCTGCRECVLACPLGAIFVDETDGLPRKCDLCGGQPLCAQVCAKQALVVIE